MIVLTECLLNLAIMFEINYFFEIKPYFYIIYKLQATYYKSLGYYLMPSYYVIVPYLNYWCNDLPNDHLYDCLMLKTKADGTGTCIYSTPCDQQLRPVCEAVIIFIKIFCLEE